MQVKGLGVHQLGTRAEKTYDKPSCRLPHYQPRGTSYEEGQSSLFHMPHAPMIHTGSWNNASVQRNVRIQFQSGVPERLPIIMGSRESVVYHFKKPGRGVLASQ